MENPNKLESTPCDKCDNLCCVSLDISELHKVAGVPCKHIDEHGKCILYPKNEEDDGREKVCSRYRCAGAGEIATEMFRNKDLSNKHIKVLRDNVFSALQLGGPAIVELENFVNKAEDNSITAQELIKDLGIYYKLRETLTKMFEVSIEEEPSKANLIVYKLCELHNKMIDDYFNQIRIKYRIEASTQP